MPTRRGGGDTSTYAMERDPRDAGWTKKVEACYLLPEAVKADCWMNQCVCRAILSIVAVLAVAGCASRPINTRIAQVDPRSGYRPYLLIPKRPNNDPHTLFILSFSGGGTRAAAFSYGVLEELRRTEVVVNGQRRRLIDEVDMITGVSGGSFTVLSYALYGDRLFSEYEERFLKRDVEGALMRRTLNPLN